MDSLETLIAEEKRLKDLYYSTKQRTNHTTNTDEIIRLWDQANKYWKEVLQLKKTIASIQSKQNSPSIPNNVIFNSLINRLGNKDKYINMDDEEDY